MRKTKPLEHFFQPLLVLRQIAVPHLRRLHVRAREQARVPTEVVESAAERLPFPDESFDHVVASIAFCSVTDLDAVLAEVRRVLRPDGSLVFFEHVRNPGRRGRWQDRFTPLQRRLADGCHLNRDTEAAIERAGFRLAELERFTLPPAYPLIKAAISKVQPSRKQTPDQRGGGWRAFVAEGVGRCRRAGGGGKPTSPLSMGSWGSPPTARWPAGATSPGCCALPGAQGADAEV